MQPGPAAEQAETASPLEWEVPVGLVPSACLEVMQRETWCLPGAVVAAAEPAAATEAAVPPGVEVAASAVPVGMLSAPAAVAAEAQAVSTARLFRF
jgi:hypothetical protein